MHANRKLVVLVGLLAACVGNADETTVHLSMTELQAHARLGGLVLKELTVTITGPDISTQTLALDPTATSFSATVVSGTNRVIQVGAKVMDNAPAYFGQVRIDLAPGNQEVVVPAYPVGQVVFSAIPLPDMDLPTGYTLNVTPSHAVVGLASAIPMVDRRAVVTLPVGSTHVEALAFSHAGIAYRMQPVNDFVVQHAVSRQVDLLVELDEQTFGLAVQVHGLVGDRVEVTVAGHTPLSFTADALTHVASLPPDTAYTASITRQPIASSGAHCTMVGGQGTLTSDVTIHVLCIGQVHPRYASAANWTEFASALGDDNAPACEAEDQVEYWECTHGGEQRVIDILDHTTCTGIYAKDSVEAFDWTCEVLTNHVRLVSRLNRTKGLTSLINFTTDSFAPLSVTITDSVGTRTTPLAVWWENPVVTAPTDGTSPTTPGEVWVVHDDDANSTTPFVIGYNLTVPNVALVTAPGLKVEGDGVGGPVRVQSNFAWVEGMFDATTDAMGNAAVTLDGTHFSTVWNTKVPGSANSGVLVTDSVGLGSGGNYVVNVSVTGSISNRGLWLSASTGNYVLGGTFAGASGIEITGAPFNVIELASASSEDGAAITVDAADTRLIDVSTTSVYVTSEASNSALEGMRISGGDTGIYLMASGTSIIDAAITNMSNDCLVIESGADQTQVLGGSFSNCASNGISVLSRNNTLANISVSHSGYDGIFVAGDNNELSGLRLRDNGYGDPSVNDDNDGSGLYVESSNNIIRDVVAVGNATAGVVIDQGEVGGNDNLLLDIVVANHDNEQGSGEGIVLSQSTNTLVVGLSALNNTGIGLMSLSGDNNLMFGLTAVNSLAFDGNIYLNGAGETVANALVMNGTTGLNLQSPVTAMLYDVAVLANELGLLGDEGGGTFLGQLRLGGNIADGFTQGPGGTLFTGEPTTGLFAGFLAADSVNPVHTSGRWTRTHTTQDWTQFGSRHRAFMDDPSSEAFPANSHRGACALNSSCAAFDFRVRQGGGLHHVLPLAEATGIAKHTWYTESTPSTQADCDNVPAHARGGSKFEIGTTSCVSTFLLSAREITTDGVGNDNGLCEAGEQCVEARNFGHYQGEGSATFAYTVEGLPGGTIQVLAYPTTGIVP